MSVSSLRASVRQMVEFSLRGGDLVPASAISGTGKGLSVSMSHSAQSVMVEQKAFSVTSHWRKAAGSFQFREQAIMASCKWAALWDRLTQGSTVQPDRWA